MAKRQATTEQTSRTISLLVSLLVRYPEVATVKYEAQTRLLRFSVFLKGEVSEAAVTTWAEGYRQSVSALLSLTRLTPQVLQHELLRHPEIRELVVTRDVATLSPEEVYLTLNLLTDSFGGQLVVDRHDYYFEDDAAAQEEYIEQLVADRGGDQQGRSLIAFREEGRIFVFNK